MFIDRIDLFDALGQHEIRVARSAYVDSAEGALAFGGRRTAPDARLVPIRLYGAFPGVSLRSTPAFSEAPFSEAQAIENAYGRLAEKTHAADGRVLAQVAVERGTDIRIECGEDPEFGAVIAVHNGDQAAKKMLPLEEVGAENLAVHARAYGHEGQREQERLMLKHLLLRIASFYGAEELQSLALDVRLHGNSYTVVDAVATAGRRLAVRHGESGGRDRKGHYHPSGRQ